MAQRLAERSESEALGPHGGRRLGPAGPPPLGARGRARRSFLAAASGLAGAGLGAVLGWLAHRRLYAVRPDVPLEPLGVLPGEFERHEALMLAWDPDLGYRSLTDEAWQSLAAVASQAVYRTQLICLVPDVEVQRRVEKLLAGVGVPLRRVWFIQAAFSLPWLGDFGPLIIKGFDGGYRVVDFDYLGGAEDDSVSEAAAPLLNLPTVNAPLYLEGGNLLSNGAGLALTTQVLIERNRRRDPPYSEDELSRVLRIYFGANQVVYLSPLAGEPTGHVDMFATMTAPDVVVVGQYLERDDAANARLLDQNAERLAGLPTSCGPLRVERIPMPPRSQGYWCSYTNVLYVNGALLVPSYPWSPPDIEQRALATYRRLLPDWEVIPVDAGPLIRFYGALHCAARSLYRAPALLRRRMGGQPARAAAASSRSPRPS